MVCLGVAEFSIALACDILISFSFMLTSGVCVYLCGELPPFFFIVSWPASSQLILSLQYLIFYLYA